MDEKKRDVHRHFTPTSNTENLNYHMFTLLGFDHPSHVWPHQQDFQEHLDFNRFQAWTRGSIDLQTVPG